MATKRKREKAAKSTSKTPTSSSAVTDSPQQPPDSPKDVSGPATDAPGDEKLERSGPPVVGIGASAGGLEAFKKLFTAMPADIGVAFVLIPHLDPKHESLMVELIARHTSMPVVEAQEGTAVEANYVYIIPPDKYLTIAGGVLRLTGPVAPGGPQTSIDLFLRSLAEDRREKAICIILSGTGSHGTLGLQAVKAAGGLAMVQDPTTADYPGMPSSAIATGQADYVLAVEQMPDALKRYVQHPYVSAEKIGVEGAGGPDHLNQILALVLARKKLDFRCYRKKMLIRRIERRMSLNHFDQFADYLTFLRENPDEVQQLSKDLLISVTSFFRDPEGWRTLESAVIAPLVQAKGPDESLRIWDVGCATGEEPYSLGVLLLERLTAEQKACPVQIFATDVDDDALEVARDATYPESISADVSTDRLARFFTRVSESAYQVSKQLRETVTFARQNVVIDPPFSKLDLIVCRNLLIYLEPDVQKKLISLLHFALNSGGFLFLGSSETIGRNIDLFEPISAKWRIYRRIGASRADRLQFPVVQVEPAGAKPQPAIQRQPLVRLGELAQNFLLRKFALACVVINRNYVVQHYAGPTEDYLVQPPGLPTQDLLSLARPGLQSKLRVAIQRAIRENAAQSIKDVMLQHGAIARRVNIDVEPLDLSKQTEGLLLVAFQEQPRPTEEAVKVARAGTRTGDADLVRQLELDLATTREELQGTIEELESSNEELKASNEETMSMNEELQSTNEELETSKEELQSLNEELNTVNNQLQEKVGDLESANNDISNLLNCTNIATVFLDTSFCIKRFTPPVTRLFKLITTDVGRPLGDTVKRFVDDDLLPDCEQFLDDLVPREKEVRTDEGRWFARRISPYRTRDNRVEGMVITFIDITERKRAVNALGMRLGAIVDSSADAIFSKDLDGIIRTWNAGAERLYGYSRDEAVGRSAEMLIPEDRAGEFSTIMSRLRRGENIEQLETEHLCKDGRRVSLSVTISAMRDADGNVVSASVIGRDISERKRIEQELRDSRGRLAGELANMARLQQLSTRLVPAGDATALLKAIVHAAIEMTSADMGNIQLFNRDSSVLRIVASQGFEPPFLEYFNSVHEGQAACGTAIKTGERVVVEDVTASPLFAGTRELDVLLSAGVRGVQTTPLVGRSGRLVGMLSTHYRVPRRPAEQDIQVLDLLARQGADYMERTYAEEEWRNGESRTKAIMNTVGDAIITVDRSGIIREVNSGAERMFGYASEEMIGQNVTIIMASPYREAHDAYISRYLKSGEKHIIGTSREVDARRKDGSVFPTDLAVEEIKDLKLFVGVHRDLTERKQLEREIVEAASLEQQRIGEDLHDRVGQELTALNMMVGDLAETVRTDPERASHVVERMAQGLRRSQRELREALRGLLFVSISSKGLVEALTELAERTRSDGKVNCTFRCPEPVSLPNGQNAAHIYLIAREAVHNSLKHAQARNVDIDLAKMDGGLVLTVKDDGVGMAVPPKEHAGLGLRIMRGRAAIIGAKLTIEQCRPSGTLVTCAWQGAGNVQEEEQQTGPDPDC